MTDATVESAARAAVASEAVEAKAARLEAIDLLRGFVIALMALDHVRDYFHAGGGVNPLEVAATDPWLYATRWITHLCAPTFVFLAGVSAWLQASRGKPKGELSRFLLTRGLWLIALEFTLIAFAWNWSLSPPAALVIWAIGASMVALAALVWLPRIAVLAVGAAIVAGHNLLDPVTPQALGALAPLWVVVHEGGVAASAFVAYPIAPWIGVMALGYGLGALFERPTAERDRTLLLLGAAMVAGFLLVRGLDVYGDPARWAPQASALATAGEFLDVEKYPPSLLYVLVTLGLAFLLFPLLARLKGVAADVLLAYGRVPLFAYVLHILLAHGLAQLASSAMGYPAWGAFTLFTQPDLLKGWGFGLPVVYGVWLLVLALLWPACRWFAEVKRTRRDWWLSYL